jgi:hypothetical protein
VPDSGRAVIKWTILQIVHEYLKLSRALARTELTVATDDGNTRRVIAPIFEPPKASQ